MDIYKDWQYRKEDVQHVADTYKISYAAAEKGLNYIINQHEPGKMTPSSAFWANMQKGLTPEKSFEHAVVTEGVPSTVIADLPQKEGIREKAKKEEVKRGEISLMALVVGIILLCWLLLMGRR